MARMKPQVERIGSLEEADRTLMEIGLLEWELERLDAEAHQAIAEIRAAAALAGQPIRKKVAEMSARLGAYAEYNKADLFKDRKTLQVVFGVFGYRKSTSISTKKTTVELLKKKRMARYVRLKEEPDKEAMAELDDETLAQVDAVRKVKDEFFCEPDREKVNQTLLKEKIA